MGVHMNVGNGESSYAKNSFLQETAIRKSLPVIKHTINGIVNDDIVIDHCYKIADLGCSSGTNTLLVASKIIDILDEVCKQNNRKSPQIQVCLNDLCENDFNTVFKLLPSFHAKLKKEKGEGFGPCFVSAVPGSFYGRLFPDESLHLVHSSYSLHWLSQVPEGIENNSLNIHMTKTSPPNVFQAYAKQFHTDFTKFLQMRSKEVVRGGRMVLTFIGRRNVDAANDDCYRDSELLAQSLLDILKKGLIQESDINSFNIPCYRPCKDEVKNIIVKEGSFSLDSLNAFQLNWDPYDTDYTNMKDSNDSSHTHAKNHAKILRAVYEPILASHFGSSVTDKLFKKYEEHAVEHLVNNKTRYFNLVIALTKK